MIKIAICDDIRVERQNIQNELERYLTVHGLKDQFEVEAFSDPRTMIRRCSVVDFNLFLLDILMPQTTGIEIAKELQEILPEAQFIFVTTTSEFVMDAISLKALYYLLKPYSPADFDEAMDRAKNFFLGEEETSVQLVDSENRPLQIRAADIIYIQGMEKENGVRLVLKDRAVALKKYTPDEICRMFGSENFVPAENRIFNIENIRHISDRAVILRNGEKIGIPKEVSRSVREAFIEYYER